jgi:hypothetical protein
MYPPSKSAALLAVVKTVAYTNVCFDAGFYP